MSSQGELFGRPHPGALLRDEGIARAERHADAVDANWADRAYVVLLEFVAANPNVEFMAEQLRDWAHVQRGLPLPPDPRAWGGTLQKAAHRHIIVRAGFRESENKQAHRRPTALWRAL